MTLALLLLACRPEETDSGPQAIEITGYLDAERVAYTATEPLGDAPVAVTITGAPGASVNVGTLRVGVGDTSTDVAPTATGAFAATIDAALGEVATVTHLETDVTIDVAIEALSAFPDVESAHASAPDHGATHLSVRLVADPGAVTLHATEPHAGEVVTLTRWDATSFVGDVPAASGDTLLLYAVADGGTGSLAYAVPVP